MTSMPPADGRRTAPTLRDRASGILLHATSLPGPHGNGDLGAEAHAFVETLARAGQRGWGSHRERRRRHAARLIRGAGMPSVSSIA
jgi:hypothetical protein